LDGARRAASGETVVVDLAADGEEGSDAGPSRSLPAAPSVSGVVAASVAGRSPVLRLVVASLVSGIQQVYHDAGFCLSWVLSCSGNVLRAAGRCDPERGRGVEIETEWGNNAGSVLFLILAEAGAECFGGEMLVEVEGFAESGRGPDNRRTNYLEAFLNDWQDQPDRVELRDLLKQAWRLVAVMSCVSWGDDIRNCHAWKDSCFSCPLELLLACAFSDEEAGLYFGVRYQLGILGYLCARIPHLPDVDPSASPLARWHGFPTRAELGGIIGSSRNSETTKLVEKWLIFLWEAKVQHHQDVFRFCFQCNRVCVCVCVCVCDCSRSFCNDLVVVDECWRSCVPEMFVGCRLIPSIHAVGATGAR